MTDFPEKIWLADDDELTRHAPVHDFWYTEEPDFTDIHAQYIRADLVPQWQPIETMPDRPGQVFLSTPNGCYNVGTVLDQWVFLWKTKEPVRRDSYSHWMPIPKVPE